MKKTILSLAIICSSIAAVGMSAPARAEMGQNSIGPSLLFGNGNTAFGIDTKFGVNESLSLRPFIYFPSGGTVFGSGLTYDFNLRNSGNQVQITPFLGGFVAVPSGGGNTVVGFQGGADFDVTNQVQLKAALVVPVTNGNSTNFQVGAGFKF
jgi:hypothetical protein